MSENTERSLAEKADGGAVDVPPRKLTIDDFLSGVRARRKAVKIRPHLHRFADLERLVDEIEAAPDGADVDHLIDEYEAARDEFEAAQWYVVEQRTTERRQLVLREAAKAHGIELDEQDEPKLEGDALVEARAKIGYAVWADAVIEPEGVGPEDVQRLYEQSPEEFTRLHQAIKAVALVLDEKAERAVLRDFSSRRCSPRPKS